MLFMDSSPPQMVDEFLSFPTSCSTPQLCFFFSSPFEPVWVTLPSGVGADKGSHGDRMVGKGVGERWGFPFSQLLSLLSQICASCHGDQARLHPGQRCCRSPTQVIYHKLPVEEADLEQRSGVLWGSTSSASAVPLFFSSSKLVSHGSLPHISLPSS